MKIVIVDSLDRGIAYGEACFETFRVINGKVFDWPAHWNRLALGLAAYGLLLPVGQDEELLFACLREADRAGPDTLVRLTISGGEASWGLATKAAEPAMFIQVMPYTDDQQPGSLRLKSWPFPLKEKKSKFTSDYAETLRALQGGPDINVLFEKGGLLIAAATANLLVYRSGQWWTPKEGAGVLPGIIRGFLIQAGLVEETDCPVEWLEDCEAIALCNSGQFIRAVCSIDAVSEYDTEHPAILGLKASLKSCDGVQL